LPGTFLGLPTPYSASRPPRDEVPKQRARSTGDAVSRLRDHDVVPGTLETDVDRAGLPSDCSSG
ncbi:hypothetical protein, partial [Xanthobacter versatilis]|uniref:hypothetical protein n=1 Tax=Xanthobacter autotrophicus (strain ATCC BAA-1158 / Py2) TaxID=78245 RepID=UPI003726FD45